MGRLMGGGEGGVMTGGPFGMLHSRVLVYKMGVARVERPLCASCNDLTLMPFKWTA